ncbi:MAG: hypothetical protein U0838_15690 [Chloroflexota bacterium]
MTTVAAAPAAPKPAQKDLVSVLLVVALAVIGIALTLGLRAAVSTSTTSVTAGGVTASVPGSWRLAVGTGGVAFVASNPNDLDQRYLVRVVDAQGAQLRDVAARESAAKASLKASLVLLETRDIMVGSTAGVSVQYAFVSTTGGDPVLIKGEDIYLVSGAQVIDLAYEAPSDVYDAGVDAFHSLVASAKVAS